MNPRLILKHCFAIFCFYLIASSGAWYVSYMHDAPFYLTDIFYAIKNTGFSYLPVFLSILTAIFVAFHYFGGSRVLYYIFPFVLTYLCLTAISWQAFPAFDKNPEALFEIYSEIKNRPPKEATITDKNGNEYGFEDLFEIDGYFVNGEWIESKNTPSKAGLARNGKDLSILKDSSFENLKENRSVFMRYLVLGLLTFLAICIPPCWFRLFGTKPFKKDSTKYGQAIWATAADIYKVGLSFKKEGMVLGKIDGRLIRTNKPLSALILAPPGTGKTAAVVCSNLLRLRNSVVVYDKKGELLALTAEDREEKLGSKILIFDPESDNSAAFNVFAKNILPEDKKRWSTYVQNISTTIIPIEEEREKFFFNGAQNMLSFFALYLLQFPQDKKELSIAGIRNFIFSTTDLPQLIKGIVNDPNVPKELQILGYSVLADTAAPEQWTGIIGVLRNALMVFSEERVVAATSGNSEITAKLLREEKISLYLKVREIDSNRLAPLIRLIFSVLSDQLISEPQKPTDNNVTFILDEFARLEKMDKIVRLPEICRGYGLNLMIIAQDYGQIEDIYGRTAIPILETNCEYKVILRQNNYNTAKKISELIGNKTDTRSSVSVDKRNTIDKESSESVSEEGIPLVPAQEILGLKNDECIIIVGGFAAKPIKAKLPFLIPQKEYNRRLATMSN